MKTINQKKLENILSIDEILDRGLTNTVYGTLRKLNEPYLVYQILFSSKDEEEVLFSLDFLPDFSSYFAEKGYSCLKARWSLTSKDMDYTEWPFTLESKDAFFIMCPSSGLGEKQYNPLFVFINSTHPQLQTIEKDIFLYFDKYEDGKNGNKR